MLRDKIFLYGLGAGIIIGAILLQIINLTSTPNALNNSANQLVSLDLTTVEQSKIADELVKRGFQVFNKDQQVYTKEQTTEQIDSAITKYKQDNPPAKSAVDNKQVSFTVGTTTDASVVASLLIRLNLIKDKDQFINELEQKKLTHNIQTGSLIVSADISQDRLIDELTKVRK